MRPLRLVRIDDVLLEVIREFNPSNFITDNGNQMNKHLIGAWVAHLDCDRVVRQDNKILICKTVEDAIIIEEQDEALGNTNQ